MLKQGIYLSILNFGGRTFNFLLYWLIANKFGANQNTDWFFFIYGLIYFINTILIKSVENVFIPIISEKGSKSVYHLFRLVWFIVIWATLIIFLLCLLTGFVIIPELIGVPIPINIRVGFLVCLLLSCQPGIALLSAFFSSWLQAKQHYFLPTIELSLRTIGIIPFLLLPICKTIFCLAMAFLVGELLRLFILCRKNLIELLTIKNKYKSQIDNSYYSIFQHTGWVSLALAFSQVNPTIDLAMVGTLGKGSITLVDYSSKIRGVPILALGGLLTLLLGEWSAQHLKRRIELTYQQVTRMTIIVVTSTALTTPLLLLTVDHWVPIVFFSKNFSSDDLANICRLLTGYLPGVPFLAGYFVFSKALLVLQKTKALAFIAMANIVLNVFFNTVFIYFWGLIGVAISTSCLDVISFLIMALVVHKNMSIKKKYPSPYPQ